VPSEHHLLGFNDAFGVVVAYSNATDGDISSAAILRANAECFDNPPLR